MKSHFYRMCSFHRMTQSKIMKTAVASPAFIKLCVPASWMSVDFHCCRPYSNNHATKSDFIISRSHLSLKTNFYNKNSSLKHFKQSCIHNTVFHKEFLKPYGEITVTNFNSRRHCHDSVIQQEGTIFSLSSGHGKCGVAVIRISGTKVRDALKAITGKISLPKPRLATLSRLVHPTTRDAIDNGLVLWFPEPHSFTGEDCAEFQVHGGPAVINATLSALHSIPGCRQAEQGEFTKRAFMNGKLDLTEVEGLGDLIHAETEIQRRQALRQMDGDLSQLYAGWRSRVLKCVADVEAYIDFSEDQNIEEGVLDTVCSEVCRLTGEITLHLNDNRQGERLREGVRVVIIGEPNVGKSSLLNLICQRPAAIVTSIPGTTRDVIETAVNIGGYPVLLSDTAGLRETDNIVEKEGVHRALKRAHQADIQVLVMDIRSCDLVLPSNNDIQQGIANHMSKLGLDNKNREEEEVFGHTQNLIILLNKADLASDQEALKWKQQMKSLEKTQICICPVSCLTGEGLTDFLSGLKERVAQVCGDPLSGHPSLTQTRHRAHLQSGVTLLADFHKHLSDDDVVMAAQSLRGVLREVGKVTGKVTSEEILDVVFRDFCIGK